VLKSAWMRNLAAALSTGLTLAVTAPACAAGPGRDFVLLVDQSGTMRYGGRGAATVATLRSLVEGMAPEDCVTVYGYGEGARPTLAGYPVRVGEGASKQALMDAIAFTFDDNRTDITAGVEIAWQERERVLPGTFKPDGRPHRDGFVILLTDGKLIPVYDDYARYDSIYEQSRKRLGELAALFGEAGVRIHTVGLGAPTAVDGELLTAVAKATGGSYHRSSTAGDLAGVLAGIAEALPQPHVAASDTLHTSDPLAGAVAAGESSAGASEVGALGNAPATVRDSSFGAAISAAAREIDSSYPALIYQASTAALGVVMGFVALGMQRRQSWTNIFTRPFGKAPLRVKGYLRPIDPQGVISARACVPLENPGLECVALGAGGQFLEDARHTLVEICGTPDASPPLLRVVKGDVTVDGQPVIGERKLSDGDIIVIEGLSYVYLRGSRR
jgi:hypothetical protein